MVAMEFFAASNSYDFFNQYCSNLLKNPTVRGLANWPKYRTNQGPGTNSTNLGLFKSLEQLETTTSL